MMTIYVFANQWFGPPANCAQKLG